MDSQVRVNSLLWQFEDTNEKVSSNHLRPKCPFHFCFFFQRHMDDSVLIRALSSEGTWPEVPLPICSTCPGWHEQPTEKGVRQDSQESRPVSRCLRVDTQIAKRCPPCNHKLTLESWLPPSIALCSRTIPTYSLPEKWQKSSQVWPLSFLYFYMLIFPFYAAKACNLMTSFCKISIKTGFMVWTRERNGDASSH